MSLATIAFHRTNVNEDGVIEVTINSGMNTYKVTVPNGAFQWALANPNHAAVGQLDVISGHNDYDGHEPTK